MLDLNNANIEFARRMSLIGGDQYVMVQAALGQFEKARRKALWSRITAWITRQPNSLISLSDLGLTVTGCHSVGVKPVALKKIIGTEGREKDFDRNFSPLQARVRDRWVSIAQARFGGADLDPVELIQVGERYFVRDGHHRISVARLRGQQMIDAAVTRWTVDGPLPWEMGQEACCPEQQVFARQTAS